MHAWAGGPARYIELQERITGIGKKMLAQTLRTSEANGLVERRGSGGWVLAVAPYREGGRSNTPTSLFRCPGNALGSAPG